MAWSRVTTARLSGLRTIRPVVFGRLIFSPSSSSSAAVDRQDDVPGLLLRFDVPGRLDHVLQRVAPIDDRPVSAGLDELLEEEDVLLRVARWDREDHFLVSDPLGPQLQDEILEPVGCQVDAT